MTVTEQLTYSHKQTFMVGVDVYVSTASMTRAEVSNMVISTDRFIIGQTAGTCCVAK